MGPHGGRLAVKGIHMRALIVDDDKDLSLFLQTALRREGFLADSVADGQEALRASREASYDAVLLDLTLPKLDGLTLLKILRGEGSPSAFVVMSRRGDERSKLESFKNGADDYVVKPFSVVELIARLQAVLRRVRPSPERTGTPVLIGGGVRLDISRRTVEARGKPVHLTKTEFQLLELLMRRPGQVLSQSVLAQHLWNADFNLDTNRVEVHIRRLRQKIACGKTSRIETARGFGYRFIA